METANPTYFIENFGEKLRVTVTHVFTETDRIEFTVSIPNTPEALPNLHQMAFGRLRHLLSLMP